MTMQEAINELQWRFDLINDNLSGVPRFRRYAEALAIAIEALKAIQADIDADIQDCINADIQNCINAGIQADIQADIQNSIQAADMAAEDMED